MIEFTESDGVYAVMKNLSDTAAEYSAALRKRAAHIYDAAYIAREKIRQAYGGAPLMELLFSNDEARAEIVESAPRGFGEKDGAGDDCMWMTTGRELDKFDMFCYCKALSSAERYSLDELKSLLFEQDGSETDGKKITMLQNAGSGRAFEIFASHVRGVEAEYDDNFKSVCDSVLLKESAFAVLPLESSTDGRLDGLYVMMEKYDLAVLMSCTVMSGDGSTTRYALVGRPQNIGYEGGRKKFEFKISLADPSEISEIFDAALFFGARLERVDTLPSGFGRDNAYGVIIDVEGSDVTGLLTYMEVRFSQFVAVGIYSHITEE